MRVPAPGWRFAVGTAVGLGCLSLAARGVSWATVHRALGEADLRLLAVAALAVVGGTALRTACWQRLYRPTPHPVTFVRAWRIVLVAQFLNISIPARVGDVARVYLIGEAGRFSKTAAATSLGLEKFFDMVALLLVLFVVSRQASLPPVLADAASGFGLATAGFALVLVALAVRAHRLAPQLAARMEGAAGLSRWWWRQVTTIVERLRILRQWPASIGVQLGYVVVWATLGLATYLVMAATTLDVPPAAPLVVLAAVQVGTAVPSTPGRIGVFQYLSVLALTPFGVAAADAFTFGVLLHVVSYAPPLLLGAIGLWLELPGLRRAGVIPPPPGAVAG